MPLAYFITFTTYGTWLHGSEKNSVDDKHNRHGTPFVSVDADRERKSLESMTQPPYVMSPAERDIVCNAIVELANDRKWDLLAVQVRRNHVHVVVSAERDPGRLMSELKSRGSRDLTLAGFDDANRRRWTRHGSTRHLFREEEVAAAIHYTLDEQGARMAWYESRARSKR